MDSYHQIPDRRGPDTRAMTIISQLCLAHDQESVLRTLRRYAFSMGFSNFGIAMSGNMAAHVSTGCRATLDQDTCLSTARANLNRGGFTGLISHSYRHAYGQTYERLRHAELAAQDSRVRVSMLNLASGAWNVQGQTSERHYAKALPNMRRDLAMSGEFGTRGGVTFPLNARAVAWGFCTFSTEDTDDIALLNRFLARANLATQVAAARLQVLTTMQAAQVSFDVTQRDILRWLATGINHWDISEKLKCSERQVQTRIAQCGRRLGVTGDREICAQALADGVICF